jgi:hypothetical protein
LDCDINAERIYTCVEIGNSAVATDTPDNQETYSEEYRRYIGQAKEHCVYNEPRRRVAGKNSGALRVEELKSAREEYEQCINDTARELWRKNNPPGNSKP